MSEASTTTTQLATETLWECCSCQLRLVSRRLPTKCPGCGYGGWAANGTVLVDDATADLESQLAMGAECLGRERKLFSDGFAALAKVLGKQETDLVAARQQLADATARANNLPGLTATLDEYVDFARLVRECLAEHDSANAAFAPGQRHDAPVTKTIRTALECLSQVPGGSRIAALEKHLAEREDWVPPLTEEEGIAVLAPLQGWSVAKQAHEIVAAQRAKRELAIATGPRGCRER
jgi:hypothetical protein